MEKTSISFSRERDATTEALRVGLAASKKRERDNNVQFIFRLCCILIQALNSLSPLLYYQSSYIEEKNIE